MRTAPAHDRSIDDATARYEAEAARWATAGRHDQAAQFYAATLDHRPGDTRVRMMLAGCLVRCSQPAAAAGEYLRVVVDYAAQGRAREAMALAYQVLHLDASQLVYVAVADVLRGIGLPAKELCDRAAEAHLKAGRLGDGLHMLQLGAELDPRSSDVRRRLAQVYLSQHMTGPAVAVLAEAGRLLLAAGNNAGYVDVAEQLLRVDPRHLETLRELPRVYLRVGEPQRAVVKLADLMRASPGDAVGYETLAHAFAVIGRLPTALSVLERLVAELVATGRASQAEAILERARGWRHDDAGFAKAVLGLREPKPAAKAKPAKAPRHVDESTVVLDITDLLVSGDIAAAAASAKQPPRRDADESTVALDITDLLVSGDIAVAVAAHGRPRRGPAPRRGSPRPTAPAAEVVLDLSDDVMELEAAELEATEIEPMELKPDLEVAELEAADIEPTDIEPAELEPAELEPAELELVEIEEAEGTIVLRLQDLSHVGRVPRRPAPPPAPREPAPARRRAAQHEGTELVGLGAELDEITLVRPLETLGDVTSFVLDEDSSELRQDPRSPAARAAMVRRARELAGRAYA